MNSTPAAAVLISALFPQVHWVRTGAAVAADLCAIEARPIDDGDLPFLKSLYASTRSREMDAMGWPSTLREAFLASQFELQHRHYQTAFPEARFLLLTRGGEPIGRLYWQAGARRARLIEITLSPAERGAGRGSGLLSLLAAYADARGLAIDLHVDRDSPARRWYARFGFEEATPSDTSDFHVAMTRHAASRSRREESPAL